jgi:hypothetical protein
MSKSRPGNKASIGAFCAALAWLALPLQNSQAGETTHVLPPGAYTFCRTDAPMGKTFYFSTTQAAAGAATRWDLQNSFMSYVRAKYKYPHDAAVSCVFATSGDLQSLTEATRLQTASNLREAQYEVVVTDWKYGH